MAAQGAAITAGPITTPVRLSVTQLTAAQLQTLVGHPVALNMPIPGANQTIAFIGGSATLHFGTVAFTGGGILELAYSTAPTAFLASSQTGFVSAAASCVSPLHISTTGGPPPVASIAGAGIVATSNGSDGATGDGTMTISVLYSIVNGGP